MTSTPEPIVPAATEAAIYTALEDALAHSPAHLHGVMTCSLLLAVAQRLRPDMGPGASDFLRNIAAAWDRQ